MSPGKPLVSILIPAHNCRPWIARAVESALEQSWQHCEVIVVDDCSTDGTSDELKRFKESIHLERATHNGGQNVTRNRLTELSNGEWLIYLDADDELDRESVEQKLQFRNDAHAIYGSTNIASYVDGREVQSNRVAAEDFSDPWQAWFSWKYPNTSAFCIKRRAVRDVGGWNETLKNCTDYDLYFRLLFKRYKFKAAPDAWSTYRQWSSAQAVNEAPLRKMTTRFQLMFDVAEQLKASEEMTPARQKSFFDASLGVLRSIYPHDPDLAIQKHQQLSLAFPECRPSKELFPARYRLLYETVGFSSAERIAELMRS
ncbi:MAG TPA: glycosyltransferase family A protein [Pyrinomonadaceae bacterium]|nr:glycosyltransferase family A protein [Pyrinomonadaceae bacterium]